MLLGRSYLTIRQNFSNSLPFQTLHTIVKHHFSYKKRKITVWLCCLLRRFSLETYLWESFIFFPKSIRSWGFFLWHDIDFILALVLLFWIFPTNPILFTITKSISEVMLCMNYKGYFCWCCIWRLYEGLTLTGQVTLTSLTQKENGTGGLPKKQWCEDILSEFMVRS